MKQINWSEEKDSIEDEEYKEVVKRLTKYAELDETYILIPIYNDDKKIISYDAIEINNVSKEEFQAWLDVTYPSLSESLSDSELKSLCNTSTNKIKTFYAVLILHSQMSGYKSQIYNMINGAR